MDLIESILEAAGYLDAQHDPEAVRIRESLRRHADNLMEAGTDDVFEHVSLNRLGDLLPAGSVKSASQGFAELCTRPKPAADVAEVLAPELGGEA